MTEKEIENNINTWLKENPDTRACICFLVEMQQEEMKSVDYTMQGKVRLLTSGMAAVMLSELGRDDDKTFSNLSLEAHEKVMKTIKRNLEK